MGQNFSQSCGMLPSNLIRKAEELLAECANVIIASVNSDGFPRPVPMAKGDTEGCGTVWMATGADSVKVADFKRNPKAGLRNDKGGSSVCLRGMVEIIDDDNTRREKWQDWYINHFPGGPDDPNYVLLRFVGTEATIWIDHEFAHIQYEEYSSKQRTHSGVRPLLWRVPKVSVGQMSRLP